jgi:murein DD-endopeptidase MepM/ murein hydrolase activator NlpD
MRLAPVCILAIALGFAAEAHAQRSLHIVRAGDTLAEIARRHRVSIDALQRENGMREPLLRPGDRLRIPNANTRDVPARRYTVRAGDTLARIARRHRIGVDDIRAANRMRGSDSLRVGEQIWVPRAGISGAEVREALREDRAPENDAPPVLDGALEAEARERARELGLGPTPIGQRLLREAPEPRWVEAVGGLEDTDGTLLLPIDGGHYLRGWGSGAEGYHLAIDIGSPQGTPIRAVERGLVAYAGRGIRGYGNLVILVHASGWVTGYAHAVRNLVVPGQIVERGDVISLVGQTGFAQGPHLHFMFVHEGRHCDPVPLFRPHVLRADGEPPRDVMELVWDTEHQPSGVQCLTRAERPHPHHNRRYGRHRRR